MIKFTVYVRRKTKDEFESVTTWYEIPKFEEE